MDRLKFTLGENAVDFLDDALSNAVIAEETPRRWKFAVLSIVQSIELSLKQLLSEVHPLFVYASIDNPDKTVTLDKAVERLRKVADFKFSKEQAQALKLATRLPAGEPWTGQLRRCALLKGGGPSCENTPCI